MRQSLLEVANLLLDEDARICFVRLYPERTDRHYDTSKHDVKQPLLRQ